MRHRLLACLLALAALFGFLTPRAAAQQVVGGLGYDRVLGVTRNYNSGGVLFRGQLVAEDSQGRAIPVVHGSTQGVIGVAITSASQANQLVVVGLVGAFPMLADGT